MKDKQKYAIKLAIDTMGKHVSRYWNTSYGSRKTGVTVGYGEAISILSDMLSNADNEPCCRCDSKNTNADRIRSISDDELAALLCKVKADYQWADHAYPDEDACGDWEEWLQSEAK